MLNIFNLWINDMFYSLSVLGVIFESRSDGSTSAEVVVLAVFVCISLLETAWDNSE